MLRKAADIAVLNENVLGRDVLIGDVHGEFTQFKNVVADLFATPSDNHNRLIIVGDLIDRGSGSLDVLQYIYNTNEECKKSGLPKKIYFIKGNHEEMALKVIKLKIKKEEDPKNFTADDDINFTKAQGHHERNGGEWLTKGKFTIDQLKIIEEILEPAPYILHVNGKNPFNVVHADMPFRDDILLDKIKHDDFSLDNNEKEYAVWARASHKADIPIKDHGRNTESIPTYCGHTIFGGARKDTNHINLDFGSYFSGAILAIDHTKSSLILYSGIKTKLLKIIVQEELQYALSTIEKQIQSLFKKMHDNDIIKPHQSSTLSLNEEVEIKIPNNDNNKEYQLIKLKQHFLNLMNSISSFSLEDNENSLFLKKQNSIAENLLNSKSIEEKISGFTQLIFEIQSWHDKLIEESRNLKQLRHLIERISFIKINYERAGKKINDKKLNLIQPLIDASQQAKHDIHSNKHPEKIFDDLWSKLNETSDNVKKYYKKSSLRGIFFKDSPKRLLDILEAILNDRKFSNVIESITRNTIK